LDGFGKGRRWGENLRILRGQIRGGDLGMPAPAAAAIFMMSERFSTPACAALIVAAGSSRRMGFDKLASPLAGLPVLRRTVEAFVRAESISEIVVVCPAERWELLEGMDCEKPLRRVDGGGERQDSVAAGLRALDETVALVAVHDGARPLVACEDIRRCVDAAAVHAAAALARRVTETLKRSNARDESDEAVSREHLWFMETPQVFELALLREAYQRVLAAGLSVTDEVSAIESLGRRVKFIESSAPNLKITTPADLALAEALLR
jgi:2-C-methyl-D-erythritol 4-phosphate cytidylyltransferase